MTEKTATTLPLDRRPAAIRDFVLQWGDMGGQWGVNRSVAQIQALLFVTEGPMNAEEIATTLGIARSNVSNSLRELQSWRLVTRVPVPGDRRDHFAAETDVWAMAKRIGAVRKEREFDPALGVLERCLESAEGDARVSKEQRRRLEEMQRLTRSVDRWYEQMLRVPAGTLDRLLGMGDRVIALLGLGAKGTRKDRADAA